MPMGSLQLEFDGALGYKVPLFIAKEAPASVIARSSWLTAVISVPRQVWGARGSWLVCWRCCGVQGCCWELLRVRLMWGVEWCRGSHCHCWGLRWRCRRHLGHLHGCMLLLLEFVLYLL